VRLDTARLILRTLEPADAEDLHAVHSDPSTFEFIGSEPSHSVDDTRARIERAALHQARHGFAMSAVVERASGRVIGDCGLQLLEGGPDVELGYRLGRDFRGRGFATEAGRAWLDCGFGTLGLDRIVAVAWPQNTASTRVMEKCGMRLVGPGFNYGHETVMYELTRSEFAPPAG
jgi:ribosomal-protein-alanine N-acetyltransferase